MSRFLHSQTLYCLEMLRQLLGISLKQQKTCFILNSFNCLKATKLLQQIPRLSRVCFIFGISMFLLHLYMTLHHKCTRGIGMHIRNSTFREMLLLVDIYLLCCLLSLSWTSPWKPKIVTYDDVQNKTNTVTAITLKLFILSPTIPN